MGASCRGCGQPISGALVTALGYSWHPEHFVCAGCGSIIDGARFFVHDQKPYHQSCFAHSIAQRCQYCGVPLLGSYLIDHWGKPFCSRHKDEYPTCQFCGRLVRPDGRRISEDNSIAPCCRECRSQAISSKTLAKHPFNAVIAWFAHRGLSLDQIEIPFELCSRERLNQYMGESGDSVHLGLTRTVSKQRLGFQEVEILGINILSGLPVTLFQGVAAHELGHAWLHSNRILALQKHDEEGFCELLAFAFYTHAKGNEAPYYAGCIEKNSDPVYGAGFRRIREVSRRHGFTKFLQILKSTRQMPM